jgi:predicted nucleic acid-binding Zn ribbon protein
MPKFKREELPVNSKVTKHHCLYCTTHFYTNRPFAKFCSDKCRVYFHQAKKATQEVKKLSRQVDAVPEGNKSIFVGFLHETLPFCARNYRPLYPKYIKDSFMNHFDEVTMEIELINKAYKLGYRLRPMEDSQEGFKRYHVSKI